jgi:hypothetical protein
VKELPAPNASPDAFIASVWDHGIEKAAELVESIASFRTVSDSLDSQINEVAWNTDVQEARNLLASHTGIFRYLNGNWRKARDLLVLYCEIVRYLLSSRSYCWIS